MTYHSNPEPFFIEKAVQLGIADPEVNEIGSMGYGAAWGDYDNDPDFDLYLTNWGVNRLYNNDDNTFTNVADIQNLESEELSNGVSWGDYNNDGMLDLWPSNIRNPDDEYFNLLYDYIRNLKLGNRPHQFTFPAEFDSLSKHKYFGLFTQVLCV